MKIFKKIMFVFVFLPYVFVSAQSYDRINNYWNNLFAINPAAINNAHLATISTVARKQWLNFPGAPATIMALGSVYFEDYYTQIGLKVIAEKKGITSYTDVDLTYAYALRLNRDWTLNMGLALSYQTLNYDRTQISFPSNENLAVYERMIFKDNLNSDFGAELYNHNWKFGFSSHNLISLVDRKDDYNLNTNLAYALYRQHSSDFVNLGVGVSAFQYSDLFQMEFNTTAYFKRTDENNPFYIGCIYRTWREFGVVAGIDVGQFSIAYSCDYNLGQIYKYSYATHEVMITWNIQRKFHCRNCWWY